MASTRNKNTMGNYRLEQRQNRLSEEYRLHPQYGTAYSTHLPGDGFLPARMPWNQLSHNAVETETFLFGIGSTNLVNPPPCFTPQIAQLSSAHLFQKSPVIMPEPLVLDSPQRPFPIPK